jgi:hypothetical protein
MQYTCCPSFAPVVALQVSTVLLLDALSDPLGDVYHTDQCPYPTLERMNQLASISYLVQAAFESAQ